MDDAAGDLEQLSRREQVALRSLLIAAAAAAHRSSERTTLERLVREARIDALPTAFSVSTTDGGLWPHQLA